MLKIFSGGIRDKDRLMIAFRGIDIIIHAAALSKFLLVSTILLNLLKPTLLEHKIFLKPHYIIESKRLSPFIEKRVHH